MLGNQRYKDRTFLVERILETAKDDSGSTESKIGSNALLTLTEVGWYLRNLIQNGLIQYNGENRTYKTTKHGEDFLHTIKKMGELLRLIDE